MSEFDRYMMFLLLVVGTVGFAFVVGYVIHVFSKTKVKCTCYEADCYCPVPRD